MTPASAQAQIAFLSSGDPQMPLSAWGWVISSLLLFAVLVWLNQMVVWASQRSRVWKRCPQDPRAWLVVWSLPRFAFVIAGMLALLAAVAQWSTWPDPINTLIDVVIVAAAVFAFIEPLIAPVPLIVPARGPVGSVV